MESPYLSDILSFEDNFISDINSNINKINQQNNLLKNDIKSIVDVGNINIQPLKTENEQLKSKAQALMKQTTSVQKHIISEIKPELTACSMELKTFSQSFQEVNLSLYYLNHLIEIYSSIKIANSKIKDKEYHNCSKLIKNIQEAIKNYVNELNQLEIFKSISNEAKMTHEHLMHKINEFWSSCISIDVNETHMLKNIVFSININYTSEMMEIFKALDCLQYALVENKFVNMIVNSVIGEIIMNKVTVTEKVNDKAVLTIKYLKSSDKPHFTEVFDNLAKVITFLNDHLNVGIENGDTFLHKIGPTIGKELAEKLMKNCLTLTIPMSSEDLEKYESVVKSTKEFQVKLKNFGFLPEMSTCLIDYAENMNILSANKFCQSYLEKARLLMKKDLQNVTTSEEILISKISILPKSYRNILKSNFNIHKEERFIFPHCQISKSAKELTELVDRMLNDMLRSHDLCAIRLFYTIRNVFEMYSAVVPMHHKKFLDTLPQQVALLHNNCIYFAHFLINLTCEYYKRIPMNFIEHINIFLEKAVFLRTLAVDKLQEHMTNQRAQLIYILLDSGIQERILNKFKNQHQKKKLLKHLLSYNPFVKASILVFTINEEQISAVDPNHYVQEGVFKQFPGCYPRNMQTNARSLQPFFRDTLIVSLRQVTILGKTADDGMTPVINKVVRVCIGSERHAIVRHDPSTDKDRKKLVASSNVTQIEIATLNRDTQLDLTSGKSIRQCMRQMQLLQSVWKGILPGKLYNRAIGFLLDSVMEELINFIMQVEDISSQTATDLASIFSIITERAPTLFLDRQEAVIHAKKWLKFNEFVAVLKGTLRDIEERWSDGKGPLAHEFTADQVKHLIRALFQNSDRRSTLLNKIR